MAGPSGSSPDDRELIDRVLAHQPDAADCFVIRFSRFVWSVLVRDFGISPERAEDLHQEVFLRLWDDDYRRLRLWRGEGVFASYLGPIVRNLALDRLRADPSLRSRQPAPDGGQPEFDPTDPEPGPEELAIVQELRERLERAASKLSKRDRELYRLRHELDMSYVEIGKQLDLSVNAVGVALARLVKKLRSLADAEPPEKHAGSAKRSPGVRSSGRETSGP
jgi:RNA polymerase sigma factor (sigma-70 family)